MVNTTTIEPEQMEGIMLFLDNVSLSPNLRVLMHVAKHRRMFKIATSLGVSRQAVTVMVERLVELGWLERTTRLGDIKLTALGQKALSDGALDVFTCAQAVRGKADEKALQRLRDRLSLKTLLGKVCRGVAVTLPEAVRLEDAGWCKREGRTRIKLTERGEQEFRLMSRGPLPGGGNRSTIVR